MLGIRPEDKTVTGLLFSNIFMSGIAISMIRVCALTLFLKEFDSEQLALIASLVADRATIIVKRYIRQRFTPIADGAEH